MGVTEAFVRILSEITTATLPVAAIAAAQRLILDGLAVAVAGSREPAVRIIAAHLRALGGSSQATAIGQGFQTSLTSAAYINGAAMHVLDYEPMWLPPNHATSTTLPAVLALGEHLGANGRDLIIALVRGVEAQGRLRVASGQYEPRDLTFHPPGVVGVIGSAIASASLLGLDVERSRHAVGIAASRASSLIGNIGTMTKSAHCGAAASGGLDAALLAARGFTANRDIIEAEHGFAEAFFNRDYKSAALTDRGTPLRIIQPGYATKMFPSQYATHFAILAALEARRKIPRVEAIAEVELVGPIMPYIDRPRPTTGLAGKFSIQYVVACALLDYGVAIDTFTDERCARPDVGALLGRIRLRQTADIPASLDKMWVEVNVALIDGARFSGRCNRPPGAWGEPPSDADHMIKVNDCMRRVLDTATIDESVEAIGSFDQLDAAGVRRLMASLGGGTRDDA
jgi:2-methylcitrate dehydratase PrpD